MKINPQRLKIILNIAAILLVLGFIFGNSLLDGQQSSNLSSPVSDLLDPLLRPIIRLFKGSPVPDELLHSVVRKLAHFCEFAALAALGSLLQLQLCGRIIGAEIFPTLFGMLVCAVTDEYIQLFTGRTSSVRDVVIDFCGGIAGVLFTLAVSAVVRWLRQRRHERNKRC